MRIRYLLGLVLLPLLSWEALADTRSQSMKRDFNGFKDLNLGMSMAEVSAIGFDCRQSVPDATPSCRGHRTIFGMGAEVTVFFRENRAKYIGVQAFSTRPVNLAETFTKALGTPKVYTSPNTVGFPFKTIYWLSKSGASIRITKRADLSNDEPEDRLGTPMYSDYVVFEDEHLTAETLQDEAASQNAESDF